MSCYFVSKTTIDAIVSAALNCNLHARLVKDGPQVRVEPATATKFGKMLWRANMISMNTRYRNLSEDDKASMVAAIDGYSFTHYRPTPAQALGCAASLAYQACEMEKWENSRAQMFCLKLQARLASELAGDAAPWGIDDASALERAA